MGRCRAALEEKKLLKNQSCSGEDVREIESAGAKRKVYLSVKRSTSRNFCSQEEFSGSSGWLLPDLQQAGG